MLLPETLSLHDKSRFEFHYIYFLPWKDQVVGDLVKEGGVVTCLSASTGAAILLRLVDIVRYIRGRRIQIVHCHLPMAGIVGRFAAMLSSVRALYTEHNNVFTYHWLTRMLHRLFLSWFDLIIAVSADAQHALQKVSGAQCRIRVVLNGVNTDKFNPGLFVSQEFRRDYGINPDSFVICTVAVFRRQKRLDAWLKIAKRLAEMNSVYRFILVGDGPLRVELQNLIDELGIGNKVLVTGLVNDPRPYLSCCDVFLMSSDYEGMPVALLEAMSMECVPVVTAVGGIPDVVTDGINGFTYAPGDLNAAATCISRLERERGLLRVIRERARESTCDRFSTRKMVTELEGTYDQLAART